MTEISERQLALIEASAKILMTKGVTGLTTKNLAGEMGFSESAIYRHYKSKDGILLHLVEFLSGNFRKKLALFAAAEGSATERFVRMFEVQFVFLSENPHFLVAILSEGLFDMSETLRDAIFDMMKEMQGHMTDMVGQGVLNGEFTPRIPAEEIAHIVIGTMRFLMLKWKMSGFQFDLREEGMKKVSALLSMIKN